MRVIAGSRRSMPLKSPVGFATRPTQDITKETLFNVLMQDVPGEDFLDLYAGSGQIGIEALSRGANSAVFVENAKAAVKCIKDNLKFTKLEDVAQVMETDVLLALERLKNHGEFGVIFMDPPYEAETEPLILKHLKDMPYVTKYTVIVIEAALDRDLSFIEENGFVAYKVKKYKTNQHIFIKRQ